MRWRIGRPTRALTYTPGAKTQRSFFIRDLKDGTFKQEQKDSFYFDINSSNITARNAVYVIRGGTPTKQIRCYSTHYNESTISDSCTG